jgi:hypothetical protein
MNRVKRVFRENAKRRHQTMFFKPHHSASLHI